MLTINDNDQGGIVKFGLPTYSVAEGATAMLAVPRTGTNLASGVTVDYAVTGGTATGGGVDFNLADGTLMFGAGTSRASDPGAHRQRHAGRGPRDRHRHPGNPTGGAAIGSPASTTADHHRQRHAGTVQFGAAAYSVAENVPAASST